MAATLIGTTVEVQFVEDSYQGRRGLKANQKIGGRYAFPDRKGAQPADGDIWQVEVAGENPSGSVYFLQCLTRVSTSAERKAAADAEQTERENLWKGHKALVAEVQNWLNEFSRWNVRTHSFELQKIAMVLRPKAATFSTKPEGLVVTIEPQVEYLGTTSTFNKVEIVLPYASLKVEKVYLRDPSNWRQLTAVVATDYGKCEMFFADHIGEVRFIGWDRKDNALTATVTFGLNGVEETVTVTVAEFKTEETGKGKVEWKVSDYSRTQPEKIDHYLPEVPQEHLDWINGLVTGHEAYGERMKNACLLAFVNVADVDESEWPEGVKPDWSNQVPRAIQDLFKELGYGGLGWSPYGVGRGQFVIHPALTPVVEGLPTVKLAPAAMREHAPESAWAAINWLNGFEPSTPKEIERLRSETIEVEEKIGQTDIQEFLKEYCQSGGKPLPCTIVCAETDGEQSPHGQAAKYVFHAHIAAPFKVRTYRKYTFGAYCPMISGVGYKYDPILDERVEFKPSGHVFENVAYGNEQFEGESQLEVQLVGRKSNLRWSVRWEAPETKQEETGRKTEAIRGLINGAQASGIILTGWRYTDTGNPVVMTGGLAYGYWAIREFDRETYNIGKRKGFGSNKGESRSTQPGPREVSECLREYKEYGWPVEPDTDWAQKAGKSILSIFPEALVAKLKGE